MLANGVADARWGIDVWWVSATVAGSLASWITNPLDLAKLRLQVSRAKAAARAAGSPVTGEVYTGFWQALNLIYKVEGVKGLFRGSVARVRNRSHVMLDYLEQPH